MLCEEFDKEFFSDEILKRSEEEEERKVGTFPFTIVENWGFYACLTVITILKTA